MTSEFPAFLDLLDLPDWIDAMSAGIAPFDGYETRDLPEADRELIRLWQFHELGRDVDRARAGIDISPRLLRLQQIVDHHRDAAGFPVYRALRISGASNVGAGRLHEPSLSSWSLKPRRALMTARTGGDGPFLLIRDRVGADEGSFYVDAFEDEVIRGAFLVRTLVFVVSGIVRLGTSDELVYLSAAEERPNATGNLRP